MSRVFTWKALGVAVGAVLTAGIICLIAGNADMASALFVVAAIEGALAAVAIGIVNGRHKRNHPTPF